MLLDHMMKELLLCPHIVQKDLKCFTLVGSFRPVFRGAPPF